MENNSSIKIEKRSATEKQKEALQKARLSKQKKKLLKENQSFLVPTPYLMGILGLSLVGTLGLYYYKSAPQNSTITQEFSVLAEQPKSTPILTPETPPNPKTPYDPTAKFQLTKL